MVAERLPFFLRRKAIADTPKTLAQLQTIFADSQSAGAITEQDVRDMIISFQREQGEIYVSSAAATTISGAGTYVKAAGTTTLKANGNLWDDSSGTDNRLRYTGTPDRTSLIICTGSLQVASTANTMGVKLYKNGSAITGNEIQFEVDNAAKLYPFAIFNTEYGTATNDYFELFVSNIDATDNITVTHMNMMALSLVQ